MISAPIYQNNHKFIDRSVSKWLDIHFGDQSFNGRVFIGHRKNGGGVYTMSARSLSELSQYVMMIHASQRLDYYITANTVSGTNRTMDGLFGLQNIVIDVDCHAAGRNTAALVQAFLWRAERDLWSDDGISFVAGNYEPLLNDEDDLVTIEKFIQRLAPYNYQPLFYDYEPNHQREDFYYEMAARGFLSLHSTTKQDVLNERLLTGQGASGALTNEPWLTADYAYKINVEDMTLSVGQEVPLEHEVIKMVGSDTVACEMLQLSGPQLTRTSTGYSAKKAGEAVVVFSVCVEANGTRYTIYSAPVCVTITD